MKFSGIFNEFHEIIFYLVKSVKGLSRITFLFQHPSFRIHFLLVRDKKSITWIKQNNGTTNTD